MAPILVLSKFELLSKVECDVSGIAIGVVLTQVKQLLAYFSEKLSDPKLNYSTYDEEFYTIIQTLIY